MTYAIFKSSQYKTTKPCIKTAKNVTPKQFASCTDDNKEKQWEKSRIQLLTLLPVILDSRASKAIILMPLLFKATRTPVPISAPARQFNESATA